MIKCSKCNKVFKYESEKKRHEQSHIPQYKCKVCYKTFSFRSALCRHQKQHNRSEKVQCKDCDRYFRDETLLKRHENYAHEGTYTCTKCCATFNSNLALSTHAKIHNPVSERRYHCSYDGCKKAFNFPHHLKHHELTHTNAKQYFCDVCKKGFIQSHHLRSHLKRHESPDSWFMCTVLNCNKKFVTEYARKRHTAAHNAVTCNKCGLLILQTYYEKHILNCKLDEDSIKDIQITNVKSEIKCDLGSKEKTLSAVEINNSSHNNIENVKLDVSPNTINDDISDCKSILGSCIVSGDVKISSDCLCAQMSGALQDYNKLTVPKESIDITKQPQEGNSIIRNKTSNNICEGCECANNCNNNIPDLEMSNKCLYVKGKVNSFKDELPKIEYKTDGTVKIKEALDFDFTATNINKVNIKIEKENVKRNGDIKFVPLNSCKAVLGNCIVSGDSTIGEGCLCAKMFITEQPMNEEIDEITPHPNVNSL